MKTLAECWAQCIKKKGEYIENKCSNFCRINKNFLQNKAWVVFEVTLYDPPH